MASVDRVLVPVEDSEPALTAARHAVELAAQYDATLWVLYLLPPDTKQALRTDGCDPAAVATRMQAVIDRIDDHAVTAGQSIIPAAARAFSQSRLTHHPGNVILEYATDTAADFIVLPRQGGVLGPAATHVLAYADQPVLSV